MSAKRLAEKGFTIVEVMIVLAVAGLILLIVFEAIPALERSGRNNQRRQDVQIILQDLSHYELNNSADLPTSGNFLSYDTNKITYYNAASIAYGCPPSPTASINVCVFGTAPSADEGPVTDTQAVYIYNFQRCDPAVTGGGTKQGAGSTDVVALYAVENGNGSTPQCQQL